MVGCKLGITYGSESDLYSFPAGHPFSNRRSELFAKSARKFAQEKKNVTIFKPVMAKEEELLTFHTQEYVNFVKEASKVGKGFLDYGDTPCFKGVYEASLFPVGSTLFGLDEIIHGEVDHFFNPIGGLHHARRDRAGGFCVFNDSVIAILKALGEMGLKKVAYVDMDAHHGDGVFFAFESDPRVMIADIHEDGKYLYPGTGFSQDSGIGKGAGTKLNIPLHPKSGDEAFIHAFERAEKFIRKSEPEFIFFQCGADGLDGDPLTHLAYTSAVHEYAAKRLHSLSHELCAGRILAMGGGGYNPVNVDAAWTAVVRELSGDKPA